MAVFALRLAAAAALGLLPAAGAWAQKGGAAAGTAPIQGQGVMQDEHRRVGPDGYVQAPIPRTEPPSGPPGQPQGKGRAGRE